MTIPSGTNLGRYEIRSKIGAGGMGEVYLAQDTTELERLAHLGPARAAMLQGDTTKARKSYEDFFALWKDADADLSVLIEAKKEYEKLK